MAFTLINDHLSGVLEITTHRHPDERGFFEELFRADALRTLGVVGEFVQDNHSCSVKGVIRGLHYQHEPPMGKLLHCLRGEIQVVELDIRANSPTFGQHVSIRLNDSDGRMLWIPPGFANGFCVLSNIADVVYKCTAYYNAASDGAINPLDPTLHIDWNSQDPIVSNKDKAAPLFTTYSLTPHFY